MVSIKDISAACGVSVATVSKALNDHNDVGAATKARIREVAKQMGYVPNSASQALKTRHSYNLGVLYKEDSESGLAHDFYAKVLDGIKRAAEEEGYDVTFVNNSSMSGGRQLSYLEHCRYRNFDGVAIVCIDFEEEGIQEVINSDFPVITLDYDGDNAASILSDNYGGIKAIVEYAYSLGHRRIAYIHGSDAYVTRERLRAFYDTCERLGLDIPEDYVLESEYRDTMSAHLRTLKLLRLKEIPSFIIYPDDLSCIGGINCLRRENIRIPEDISICGFDGIELGRYLEPVLTTYVQNSEDLGYAMGTKLLEHIRKGRSDSREKIIVPGYLFHGGSVIEN